MFPGGRQAQQPPLEVRVATYSNYLPSTPITTAMFNFDAFGWTNFRLVGTIRVTTSDSFSYSDYLSPTYSVFSAQIFSSALYTSEFDWQASRISNVQDILAIYEQFVSINFEWRGDFDTAGLDPTVNPEDVGRTFASDINVAWLYRPDVGFGGISGGYTDSIYGYTGGAGDIFLNGYSFTTANDINLGTNSKARQVLMHELGHSLGLSHPHTSYSNGQATISSDYANTVGLGFQQLGFNIGDASDMYKEYFTIMSYDDQVSLRPGSSVIWHAHTPMILDVIALQQAYGEGDGTTGAGNDTIPVGTAGYRTYFDKGGVDTIDMSSYTEGAYLNMGVTIAGATHLVGVAMNAHDAAHTILDGGDPAHLRWFYGEFENARGSAWGDLIVGSALSNSVSGMDGNDVLLGEAGDDSLSGGAGNDDMAGGAGNDVFDWDGSERGGNDTMSGGVGDDVYVLDSVFDIVVENASEGVDTVFTGSNFTLGTYVENLGTFSGQQIGVRLEGNGWTNRITGGAGHDTLIGNDGDDTLTGEGGSDSIEGGAGLDTATYAFSRSAFTISQSAQGFSVNGQGAVDTLVGVERLTFADSRVALDVSGAAGQAYRLYQAAFNRTPDVAGLGYQMNAIDHGMGLSQVAANFIASPEFQRTYGTLDNSAFVTQLYANVLHRLPDSGGLAFHVANLARGVARADVLIGFSESPENQVAVIGAIANGMTYVV
jgi:Ca2+-binding RTX toxin-like protein